MHYNHCIIYSIFYSIYMLWVSFFVNARRSYALLLVNLFGRFRPANNEDEESNDLSLLAMIGA
jgi:hypothetical protein